MSLWKMRDPSVLEQYFMFFNQHMFFNLVFQSSDFAAPKTSASGEPLCLHDGPFKVTSAVRH